MQRVVLRAEQAGFFERRCHEQDRTLRRRLLMRERVGDFEQSGEAGAVVDGAVVDLVALQFRIAAEMIPMRRVDDHFVRPLAARQQREHVRRLHAADLVGELRRELRVERRRLEAADVGGFLQRIEIRAGFGEQALRRIGGDPSGDHHARTRDLRWSADRTAANSSYSRRPATDNPRRRCRARSGTPPRLAARILRTCTSSGRSTSSPCP